MINIDKLKSDPEDLIELLRCAVDLMETEQAFITPLSAAAALLHGPDYARDLVGEALDLRITVSLELRKTGLLLAEGGEHRKVAMLELAQRLEDAVVRQDAILICDVAASLPDETHPSPYLYLYNYVDTCDGATTLACSAWCELGPKYDYMWPRERDAEAAQMLREGWTP